MGGSGSASSTTCTAGGGALGSRPAWAPPPADCARTSEGKSSVPTPRSRARFMPGASYHVFGAQLPPGADRWGGPEVAKMPDERDSQQTLELQARREAGPFYVE